MKNLLFITILFFYFTGKLFGQTEGIQLYAKLIDNSRGFTKCADGKSAGTFIFKIISSTDPKMIPGNTIAIVVICPVNLQRGLNVDQGYHLGLFNTPNCNGTLVENLLEDGGSFIRKHNKSEQLYWTNALDELNPDFIRMVEVKQGIADFTASELNKEEPFSGEYYVTSDTEPKEKKKNELVTNDNFSFETRSGESYLQTDSIGIYVDTTKMDYYDYRFKGYQMYVYNVSKFPIAFPTIDNRLCMVAQARDESGVWHDIEKLSPSGCGNSYYDVFLNQGNQWKVVAPIPSGKFCTKLRLAVYYRTPNGGKVAYSNEYSASINLGQLIIEK